MKPTAMLNRLRIFLRRSIQEHTHLYLEDEIFEQPVSVATFKLSNQLKRGWFLFFEH